DAEGERQNRERGKAWLVPQAAKGVANVLPETVHVGWEDSTSNRSNRRVPREQTLAACRMVVPYSLDRSSERVARGELKSIGELAAFRDQARNLAADGSTR